MPSFSFAVVLDKPCVFERFVSTIFCDGFDRLGRDGEGDCFVDLGDKNALFLEVYLFAHLTCWVKFRGTNTVTVAASHY